MLHALQFLQVDVLLSALGSEFGKQNQVCMGVIKEIRQAFPDANIVAIDYDPGASEVNQINRIKLMLSAAEKNMNK